ncbi:MAG: molybdopterin converting factor subunit 1 [Aquificaceae bacterium]|jgi:molybdopterin synthase sulfur carrier subunit|uniref:molybdopterin converting factor subunit 1 n=1 Tax=Hydrogenobacter sp. Uz 6-8 TaxID=3384828 RepID=UPI000F14714E|nr:MAG: molybdopterin converting factor subunit 1 [Aquificota bacterium]
MKLLYFAIVRERLKRSEEDIDFTGTVAELRKVLIEKYPELEPILQRVKFAVNEEYVEDEYMLRGEERVAIIPPVSGG